MIAALTAKIGADITGLTSGLKKAGKVAKRKAGEIVKRIDEDVEFGDRWLKYISKEEEEKMIDERSKL